MDVFNENRGSKDPFFFLIFILVGTCQSVIRQKSTSAAEIFLLYYIRKDFLPVVFLFAIIYYYNVNNDYMLDGEQKER